MNQATVTALHLEERDGVPNNPRLPVLVYEAAFSPETPDLAAAMEKRFAENGWPPQWRNGIYDFHHYHSQGHEVLGIAAGSADITLGGPCGRDLTIRAGDVLLLSRRHRSLSRRSIGRFPRDRGLSARPERRHPARCADCGDPGCDRTSLVPSDRSGSRRRRPTQPVMGRNALRLGARSERIAPFRNRIQPSLLVQRRPAAHRHLPTPAGAWASGA
ncbi:hypothetical protein [Bosea sp. NBC_00550]|uniref:hypothetical protein n=1 Tax=Bosea sp. NBC_00550 TaxID=2969621 RepID=UPI003FA42D0C